MMLKCLLGVTFEGRPKKKKHPQAQANVDGIRGSSGSPGQQDDGSLIGEWRWVGEQVTLQPISPLRERTGPSSHTS